MHAGGPVSDCALTAAATTRAITQGAYGFTDSNDVYGHHAEHSLDDDEEGLVRENELYGAHSPRRTALPMVVVHDEDDEHHHHLLPELCVWLSRTPPPPQDLSTGTSPHL